MAYYICGVDVRNAFESSETWHTTYVEQMLEMLLNETDKV